MKLNVYSYVVLYHPKKKDDDEDTKILKREVFHLAASVDAVKIDALRCLPETVAADRVEVIVRPF